MGTIIEIGGLYKSPKYPDYFEVMAIDKEDDTGYTLAILWVDPVTNGTKAADLVLSHADANQCTEVEL